MKTLSERRIRIDQMNERILSGLKDRSRFRLNPAVYETNGVMIYGMHGISLFRYAVKGLEEYQKSLGRFQFPDQQPLIIERSGTPHVKKSVPDECRPFDISLEPQMTEFYLSILPRLCEHDNDPETYGETAYVDAGILYCMNDRINIGRHVAESKLVENPCLIELAPEALSAALRNETREREAIDRAELAAIGYKFDPKIAKDVIRWLMDQTLQLEVKYVQRVAEVRAR